MPEYSFVHDPEVDHRTVYDSDQFETLMRELSAQKSFTWDVEGDGVDPFKGRRIIGHGFAWRRENGQLAAFYVPTRHESLMGLLPPRQQLDADMVTAAVKPVLENQSGMKCGHYLHTDVMLAWADGIQVSGPLHDTLTASKLINENLYGYKLTDCLRTFRIKHDPDWKKSINPDIEQQSKHLFGTKGIKKVVQAYGYKYCDTDLMGTYACQDVVYEQRLAEYQVPFNQRWWDTWQLEMELFWCAVDMRKTGVPVVPQVLQDLAEEQQERMRDLQTFIWKLAAEEFDVGNDNELRRILFEKLGYPSHAKTKGQWVDGEKVNQRDKVDDDALWWLEKFHGCQLAKYQREWNKASKIVSTYTLPIIDMCDPHNILHTEFDPGGAKTGRFSSREPNLQNIPIRTPLGRRIREAFVTRPGMIRYCLDYSQIELRVLAHLSQDPLLLKVYREGGDVHRTTAMEVFGSDQKVDGIDMRRLAKILNFGIPFGITEIGVQRNLNKDLPEGQAAIDEERATWALNGWYHKYAGVDAWRKSIWYQFAQNGGEGWNMFGRPRRVEDIMSDKAWKRSRAEREITSTMAQGGAADLIKRSMLRTWQYLKAQQDCEAYMVLMIHDDLQFDMVPDGSAKVIRECKRIMESTCQDVMSVPIKVDAEYFTDNWKNKREMEAFN